MWTDRDATEDGVKDSLTAGGSLFDGERNIDKNQKWYT